MTSPRAQMFANMTTRQKATAGVFILILLFLLYQIYAMLGGGGGKPATPAPKTQVTSTIRPTGPGSGIPFSPAQAIQAPKPSPVLSQREMELLKLQQETEAKYVAALNELQMLKIEQQIAETTRAIMAAKLDTVTSQKGIVNLLKPPAPVTPAGYAQGLVSQIPGGAASPITPPPTPIIQAPSTPSAPIGPAAAPSQGEATYTVISVSQLQNKWNAVLGFQGSLYSVYIGDYLPPDQSKVITIDRTGVVLERNGIKKKVSLVPII